MTEQICIEWSFEDNDNKAAEINILDSQKQTQMSLTEELDEIVAPLSHPIGTACIQIVGLSACYECMVYYCNHRNATITEDEAGGAFPAALTAFLILLFLSWKYWLPRHTGWIPLCLLAFIAWLIIEWSRLLG